jgi:hypothetical protein
LMLCKELSLGLFFDVGQGSCFPTLSWATHGTRDNACCSSYSSSCSSLTLGPSLLSTSLDICQSPGSCVPSCTDRCTTGCSRLWFGDWLALDNERWPNFGKLNLKERKNRKIKCFLCDHRGGL